MLISFYKQARAEDLHSDASNTVSGIPETDISCVWSSGWCDPWHGEKKELNNDVEDNRDIPRFEFCTFGVDTTTAPSDNIESHTDCEREDGIRIRFQIDGFTYKSVFALLQGLR